MIKFIVGAMIVVLISYVVKVCLTKGMAIFKRSVGVGELPGTDTNDGVNKGDFSAL